MATLNQIYHAIDSLTIIAGQKETVLEPLGMAIRYVEEAISGMNELEIKGRDNVDVLLGCMMATEAIIGEEPNGQ